ncbi:hypothetical protein [Moorena producens]|uniref:hypothetical protein n=1 Tax=Moorena producens TaxID=1155739 RepID=UPI001314E6A7|nr:hypothetical protein [Moorena producens]
MRYIHMSYSYSLLSTPYSLLPPPSSLLPAPCSLEPRTKVSHLFEKCVCRVIDSYPLS